MLIPAIKYKDEIEEWSDVFRYSTKMMYYNGCRDHGRIYISDRDDDCQYQWAIVDNKGKLIGYIAYIVDHFSRSAYSFGLIAFRDDKMAMAMGIRDAILHIEAMHLHRIEFRAVKDNPAVKGYERLLRQFFSAKYMVVENYLHDVFKDEGGQYHDVVLFELIRSEL